MRTKDFILSVEGNGHINRGLWTTHKVLGAFSTRDAAVKAIPSDFCDEDIVIVTNVKTGLVERIPVDSKENCP